MRKTFTIVAAIGSILLALPGDGQSTPDLAAQWRAKMKPAKNSGDELANLQAALKIAEQFGDTDPRLFESLIRLADYCEYQDCDDQVNGYIGRALPLIAKIKPQDAPFASLLMELGGVAAGQGQNTTALAVYRDALSVREKLFGADDQSVAEIYAAMAHVYQSTNDAPQARRTMQYALEIRQRAHKEQSEGFANLLDDSARIYSSAGDEQRAESEYERAIAIRQRLWGDNDPRFVRALKQIAAANQFGRGAGFSEGLYRRIVEIQKTTHTERSEAYSDALMDLGFFLQFHKRFTEGENSFEQAFAVREGLGEKDAAAAFCMQGIAQCRMGRGMYKQAAEAGEVSVQLRARLQEPVDRDPTLTDGLLAEAYLRAHDAAKSEAYFRALSNQLGPAARYTLIDTSEKLSAIYQERGDYPQAASKLEVAVAAIEAGNPADERLPQQEARLAQLYQKMGRANDANRMNMAVLRSLGRNLKKQGNPKTIKYLLIGAAVILLMPIVGTATFGLLFGRFARKMDRRLAALYLPDSENADPGEQINVSYESAYVGGFLGLSSIVETEVAEPALPAADRPVATALEVMAAPQDVRLANEVREPPVSQVTLRADGSDLFAMRVLNLLFSLLTLGIYTFWGKAKVRRYVCGQAEYQGDWFAFHGTGRELLLGWLRALPALAFIFLFPTLLPLFWQNRAAPYVAQLSAVAALLLLWPSLAWALIVTG